MKHLKTNFDNFLNENWQDNLHDKLKNSTPYLVSLFDNAKKMDRDFAASFLLLFKKSNTEMSSSEEWKELSDDFRQWYDEN
jgi:hypothetical protein